MLNHISQVISMDNVRPGEKFSALTMDEMKIRSGLVYKGRNEELIGYCSLDTVNDELESIASSLSEVPSKSKKKLLASHVFVFFSNKKKRTQR